MQVDPDEFSAVHSSDPKLKLDTISTRSEIRYKGGAFRVRRQLPNSTLSIHCQFPDSTTGNTLFYNSITADAFQTSSDERNKDNYEEISAEESWDIVELVNPQKYVFLILKNNHKGMVFQHQN